MNQWSNLSAGDWISKPDKIDWSAQLNKADLGTSFSEDDVRVCVDSSRSQKSVRVGLPETSRARVSQIFFVESKIRHKIYHIQTF